MIENTDATVCFDNGPLYDISLTYRQLNEVLSTIMAGVTTSFRFPGLLNSDLRKLAVSMVPFPSRPFLMPGLAPLAFRGRIPPGAQTLPEITRQVFSVYSTMVSCNPRRGQNIAGAAIFRGQMSMEEIDKEMSNAQKEDSHNFVDRIPDNVKTSLYDFPLRGHRMSATTIANNTAIERLFRVLATRYWDMICRRAFLHWYKGVGMEVEDFDEAYWSMFDLLSEYRECENVTTE